MENLIREAREQIPFNMSLGGTCENGNCEGRCDECPSKLIEFLDTSLSNWESRLKNGHVPSLGDVHTLGRECREIYEILQKQGFVK